MTLHEEITPLAIGKEAKISNTPRKKKSNAKLTRVDF
jgi:hypothetical protein